MIMTTIYAPRRSRHAPDFHLALYEMGPTQLRDGVLTGKTNTVDTRFRNHLFESSLRKLLIPSRFLEERVPDLAHSSLKSALVSSGDNIDPVIVIRTLVTDFLRCTYCVVTQC